MTRPTHATVPADLDAEAYLTPGKNYPILMWDDDGLGFTFRDDNGVEQYAHAKCSSHIGNRPWLLTTEPPAEDAAAQARETVYQAVERVLDEESAWVARPNARVTERVALVAAIACQQAFGEDLSKAQGEIETLLARIRTMEAAIAAAVAAERERCAMIVQNSDSLDPYCIASAVRGLHDR